MGFRLQLSATPQLTADEIAGYLPAIKQPDGLSWVSLQPLGSERNIDRNVSHGDLIQRLLAAKIAGADAIFIPRPFDPASGLLNDDGSPTELLLPWRTTALAWAGTEYLGSLQLPRGSTNHLFVRGDDVVMVVWNRPAGRGGRLLGRRRAARPTSGADASHPARPTGGPDNPGRAAAHFVTGSEQAAGRWSTHLRFASDQMPSVCGVPFDNSLTIKNFFPQGVSGRARIVGPTDWKIDPP